MACKHTGARGIILGLVYVLAMIFVAPLRLTDAYEAVTLLLPGAEGTLPLLALGAVGAIPVGAFLAALPRRIQNRRQGVHVARSTARECLYGFAGGFVLLLGAVFFHEKITPVKVSCMLAAVVGCALISGVFDSHSELVWSSVGILTGLGSAFFNAIYTINSKQLTERNYHALTINIYVFAITTLILTPFADWNAIGAFVSAAPLKGSAFYFAQALVTSILPNFFYAFSIKYIDSGNAAILSCGAEPTAAMLLGILLYTEIPAPSGLLGLALTISALIVLTKACKTES